MKIMAEAGYSPLKDQGSAPDPCLTLHSWGEGVDLLSKSRAGITTEPPGVIFLAKP